MTDNDSTSGVQPTNEANVDASAQQAPLDYESATPEQLLEALVAEPQATPQEQAPPVTPPSAQQADDDEVAGDKGTKAPNRLSVRALPAEQQLETADALAMVREGKAVDLLDALTQIRGLSGRQASTEEEAPPPAAQKQDAPPDTQPSNNVSAIQEQLTALREQRLAAKRDYDVDEEERIQGEIEDTLIRLQEAKIMDAQESKVRSTYQQEYDATLDDLEAKYPDILDDKSEFSKWLYAKVTTAKADNDPALKDPKYLAAMADEVAGFLSPKGSGRPPTQPAPLPRANGRAVAPAHVEARYSEAQAKAIIDEADPDAILAALNM